jgi:predicted Kef-type K+ transport protein
MDVIWIVAAFAAGFVARQLRLPTLVGYLAAGILLSLAGVQTSSLIGAIADFGVILLLFTVGLHIRLKNLLQLEVFGVGTIHMVISSIVFLVVLLVGGLSTIPALLIAIGLSFSSTVLTAKSLDARSELDTYHGRIAIGVLVLQDIVAVVLLIFTGAGVPSPWAVLLLGLPLLRPVLLWMMRHSGREEVLILYGLFLALGVGYLFELVGLDGKLGALVAGLVLAGADEADELYDILWGLKEIFLVGFFLEIGLSGLPSLSALPIVLVFMALLPLKAVLFFALFTLFRLRARTAFLSTIALTAYSEFALIVTSEAADAGLVGASFVSIVGLLVILSFIVNAPLSRYVNALWNRWESRLVQYERHISDHPDQDPRSLGLSDFVIVGMGLAGSAAYDFLRAGGSRPVGLDADPAQIADNIAAGRRVLYGDANDSELWTDLDLSHIVGVILTVPNAEAMAATARYLRREGYDGPISALLRSSENRGELEAAGVTTMLMPMEQAGRDLAQACLVPA